MLELVLLAHLVKGSGDRGARYVILQHNGQESSMDIAQLGGVLLKLTLRNK